MDSVLYKKEIPSLCRNLDDKGECIDTAIEILCGMSKGRERHPRHIHTLLHRSDAVTPKDTRLPHLEIVCRPIPLPIRCANLEELHCIAAQFFLLIINHAGLLLYSKL